MLDFAVPIAPFAALLGVNLLAHDRGYATCPPPAWNRYGSKHWARDIRKWPVERIG